MNRMGMVILSLFFAVICAVCVFAEPSAEQNSNLQQVDDDKDAVEEQSDLCIPLAVPPLGPPEGIKATRALVEFPHARHFAYSCQTCHHKWQGDAKIQSCMASGCHDMTQKSNIGIKSTFVALYYKDAYHRSCKGCHMKIKQRNRALSNTLTPLKTKVMKTGPTGCIECHPKK